jgi:cytoskeleton protein RodZ
MTEQETEFQAAAVELSVGQQLAQARNVHNLSVADVAGKLRLAARQIEAIEANDFERLPGRTIVRGFVRNYAKLVQLDPAQMVATFDRTVPDANDQRISVPHQNVQFSEVYSGHRNRSTLWLTLGLLVMVIIGYLAWRWEAGMATPAKQEKSAIAVPQTSASNPAPAANTNESLPVFVEPRAALDSLASGAAIVASAAFPTAASNTENLVHLAFDGPSWVEVRDAAGQVVLSKMNLAGTEQDINAPLPLTFIIGNATKVKMARNGDAYDLSSHIDGTIARFKLER